MGGCDKTQRDVGRFRVVIGDVMRVCSWCIPCWHGGTDGTGVTMVTASLSIQPLQLGLLAVTDNGLLVHIQCSFPLPPISMCRYRDVPSCSGEQRCPPVPRGHRWLCQPCCTVTEGPAIPSHPTRVLSG